MFKRFALTAVAAGLAAVPLADGTTSPESTQRTRIVEGTRVDPVDQKSLETLKPRTAILLGDRDLSEDAWQKAAGKAADSRKGTGAVEQWIIPREWFVPIAPGANWGLLDADFYLEDDGDLVIFPHLDSGYESCCFAPSFGSWYSGLVEIPGIQDAQEVFFSYKMSRANEWVNSKPLSPQLRLRSNSGDWMTASTFEILSLGTASVIPDKNDSQWYDFSVLPTNGYTNDLIMTNMDILAIDPTDSADIGWKIKDDVIVTVYY